MDGREGDRDGVRENGKGSERKSGRERGGEEERDGK